MPSRRMNSTTISGTLVADAFGSQSSNALFIDLLQSRTVQDHLIDKFDLKRIYRDRSWQDVRKDLEKSSEISEDSNGSIVIRVRDGKPDRAAAMAQDYTDELNLLLIQLNTSSAHRERLFLEERLEQVGQDLESEEKELSRFASDNLVIDMDAQGNTTIQAAEDVQAKLIAEQAELKSLESVYTDGNLQVRATQAKMHELQQGLARLVGESNSANPTKGNAPTGYPSIRQLPLLGTGYADLDRSVEMGNALFGTLTKEYQAVKLAEVRDTPSVRILDPPEVPEKKCWPPRRWIILLSTVCSFSLGVIWIFGAASWGAVNPADPWKLFAIEVFQTTAAYFQWKAIGARTQGTIERSRLSPSDSKGGFG